MITFSFLARPRRAKLIIRNEFKVTLFRVKVALTVNFLFRPRRLTFNVTQAERVGFLGGPFWWWFMVNSVR